MTAPDSLYVDHNATTPIRAEAFQAMCAVLTGVQGNPASGHARGRAARAHLDRARRQVADLDMPTLSASSCVVMRLSRCNSARLRRYFDSSIDLSLVTLCGYFTRFLVIFGYLFRF